nr:MAG TPA_asm: hypothetical protein [Caudoviricetes sp.]
MREIHKSNKDKRLERENIKLIGQIQGYEDSKPEHRDPKAYKKFKAEPTYYGSGRMCSYGDKTKVCDLGCIFWNTCVKGRHREEA